jgi:hypothetical protein
MRTSSQAKSFSGSGLAIAARKAARSERLPSALLFTKSSAR